jgi:hypothetical protein
MNQLLNQSNSLSVRLQSVYQVTRPVVNKKILSAERIIPGYEDVPQDVMTVLMILPWS